MALKLTSEQQPALLEYMLEIADDHLILGHRLSEWCGHGPMLEEDIALANLALDCIGIAKLLYEHASVLDSKKRSPDQLVFFRPAAEFRNCRLVTQHNRDFAWTIARQLYYDLFSKELFSALASSSYQPLADIAVKAQKETAYHLRHSSSWVIRLGDGTAESRSRTEAAIAGLLPFCTELFVPTAACRSLLAAKISVDPASLQTVWNNSLTGIFAEATLTIAGSNPAPASVRDNAAEPLLAELLSEMQSTARAHPGATW